MAVAPVQNSKITIFTSSPSEEELLSLAEESEEAEVQELLQTFQSYKDKVRLQIEACLKENRELRLIKLPDANGRETGLAAIHKNRVTKLKGKIQSSLDEIAAMRQKVTEAALKQKEEFVAQIAARKAAVDAETLAGDARIAQMRETIKAHCKSHYEPQIQNIYAHQKKERERITLEMQQDLDKDRRELTESYRRREATQEIECRSQVQEKIQYFKRFIIDHNAEFRANLARLEASKYFSSSVDPVSEHRKWEMPPLSVPDYVAHYPGRPV